MLPCAHFNDIAYLHLSPIIKIQQHLRASKDNDVKRKSINQFCPLIDVFCKGLKIERESLIFAQYVNL